MKSLIRWEPGNLLDEVDRLFFGRRGSGTGYEVAWTPAIELAERNGSYLVKAELPGVEKKDLRVTIGDGVLTIKAERKEVKEEKTRNGYHSEFRYGSFYRAFELPSSVKADDAKVSFRDGVLELTIPKVEKPEKKATELKIE